MIEAPERGPAASAQQAAEPHQFVVGKSGGVFAPSEAPRGGVQHVRISRPNITAANVLFRRLLTASVALAHSCSWAARPSQRSASALLGIEARWLCDAADVLDDLCFTGRLSPLQLHVQPRKLAEELLLVVVGGHRDLAALAPSCVKASARSRSASARRRRGRQAPRPNTDCTAWRRREPGITPGCLWPSRWVPSGKLWQFCRTEAGGRGCRDGQQSGGVG